ncbi:MAG: BamA/TamA family outer membrane protein [Pseudomonadota bacterium]
MSFLAVALAAVPSLARAEGEEIVAIDVVENTKTDDATVALIADVSVGDRFTYSLADRIRSALVTSGLFQDIRTFTSPEKGGVKLTIIAKEKHSWVIAPTFYNQPGNTGFGFGYGNANLFGQNRKLLLYGQLATADSLLFGVYLDPAIAGSRFYWRTDVYLRHARVTEYTSPSELLGQPVPERLSTLDYLNGGVLLGVNLWRGLALDARLRGAYVYFSDVAWANKDDHADQAESPQDDGWDVTYNVRLIRDRRANWHGVTTGTVFQLSWEQALPDLGSDVDYWMTSMGLTVAQKFLSRHNLVWKAGLGFGNQLPFQQEYTAGGAPGLRGYQTWQFRGDMKTGSTLEYSLPLFDLGPFSFRGLGFWDSAFATFLREDGNTQRHYLDGQTTTKLAQWRNGIGAGFRVYVRSIVLPLVGLDFGYGIEAQDYHVYLALGLVEL